jgi:hypothetical protein
MAVLSWGKPKVEYALLGADGTPGAYKAFPEIVEDTALLEVTEGDELTAPQEGGELVDSKRKASSYVFNLSLYAKKGDTKPIPDVNGVVAGNYAIRLTPEDPQAIGFLMVRTSASAGKEWASATGMYWNYSFTGLTPVGGGEICAEYSEEVTPEG